MKKLVVLLLASLVATSAFAIIDPDDNMIGIYFDLTADTNCGTGLPSVPFDIYLIATNPTSDVIGGYELGFNWTGAGAYYLLTNQSSFTGIDVGEKNATSGIGDYIMGWAAAQPAAPAMVLHKWTFMQLGATFPMQFFITQATVTSIEGATTAVLLGQPGELYTAGQSTGGPDIPVAVVNDPTFCPVGVEDVSFGSVKSLFR